MRVQIGLMIAASAVLFGMPAQAGTVTAATATANAADGATTLLACPKTDDGTGKPIMVTNLKLCPKKAGAAHGGNGWIGPAVGVGAAAGVVAAVAGKSNSASPR